MKRALGISTMGTMSLIEIMFHPARMMALTKAVLILGIRPMALIEITCHSARMMALMKAVLIPRTRTMTLSGIMRYPMTMIAPMKAAPRTMTLTLTLTLSLAEITLLATWMMALMDIEAAPTTITAMDLREAMVLKTMHQN
jgi:hypothetical protein